MKLQRFLAVFYAMAVVLSLFWGCRGNQPVAPAGVAEMSVYVPENNEVKASLLNAAQNEILYRVDGPGMASVRGTAGPFSTSGLSGSIDFTVDVPLGPSRLLSVQLNDASTNQPLALGATSFDLTGPNANRDIVVDMGSVTRTCYYVDEKNGLYGATGSTYGFATDTLLNQLTSGGFTYDVGVSAVAGSGFLFVDAQATSTGALSSIAYLGNGDLVDYDKTPPNSSYFFTDSGSAKGYAIAKGQAAPAATDNLQAGDVYYLDLSTIAGAHAWVQVTDPGFPGALAPGYGPSFRFRINRTLPYYGYDQTPADTGSSCSSSW